MHQNWNAIAVIFTLVLLVGCATVDVTKTARGHYEPTRADEVDILMTKPDRNFIELGTVSTRNWRPGDTAKMHNALRNNAAPLGAHAVILLNSGIDADGRLWSTGVAVRYE